MKNENGVKMIWTTSTTSTSSTEKICQKRAMWEGQSLTFFFASSRRVLVSDISPSPFFCWTRFFLIFFGSARFGFHGRLSEPWFSLDTEKRNSKICRVLCVFCSNLILIRFRVRSPLGLPDRFIVWCVKTSMMVNFSTIGYKVNE